MRSFMEEALKLVRKKKVAIFIVLYNSEKFIKKVVERIPRELRDEFAEIYIIDDSSSDGSYKKAQKIREQFGLKNLRIMRTPYNRGYGGNQKLGYLYAIKKKYDIVVLLHGDGQYAPESLPDILAPFADPDVDAVFGSRMISRQSALRGGMPLYKWIGNIILTKIENSLLHTNFSEFHSGYRAYRVRPLSELPFTKNSDVFHFDTDIIIQLIAAGKKIVEVMIPTYYGTEICHVNGLRYAWDCLISVLQYRMSRLGIFYEPKFDIASTNDKTGYLFKRSPHTIHQYVLTQKYDRRKQAADLGSHEGVLSSLLARKIGKVISVDIILPQKAKPAIPVRANLEQPFATKLGLASYDYVFALDVIEHLGSPEATVRDIFRMLKPGGRLYASTGNIAYIITRLSLAAGMFNYGKKGILDLTHKRLFTAYSFSRLLRHGGFRITKTSYFPPPLLDYSNGGRFMRLIDSVCAWLARTWPSLFAYQFLIEAERLDSVDEIFDSTVTGKGR